MAVNKVDYFGENLIDLTNDTVTESTLLSGATAHDKSGNLITGNVTTAEVIPTKAEVESNATPGKVADALVTKEVLEAIKVLQNAGYLTEETDPTVPAWAKEATKPTYTASEVGALPNDTTIPSALSDMSEDTTHRVVTDAEKQAWNGKSDFSGSYNDLTDKPTIPGVATSTVAGTVKPDGTTTTIDEDGTIHATGGGGTSVDILATKEEVQANTEAGKIADALVTKELSAEIAQISSSLSAINESIGGEISEISEIKKVNITTSISGIHCYKCGRVVQLIMENASRTIPRGNFITNFPKPLTTFVASDYNGNLYSIGSNGTAYTDGISNRWTSFNVIYLTNE